jgi:hypothetical protein
MSEFSGTTFDHAERTNVRSDFSWYPRAFFTATQEMLGATILSDKGKRQFREFVRGNVKLPTGDARKLLAESIATDVDFWAGMNEDFGDEGDDLLSGQDEVIHGWAVTGEIPDLLDAITELSMPGLSDECARAADRFFPDKAARAAEREELISYRVERWLGTMASQLKGKDWIKRVELWTAYEIWCKCDGTGQHPGQPKDFYEALRSLGFSPSRRHGTDGFKPPIH